MSSIYRKTAAKAWNCYQIWIWRNGARIFRLEQSNRIFRKFFLVVHNLFSALLRIISFTKIMIVMKWIWICKVHHICKPIQFRNLQERSRNDNAIFQMTTVLRIQPHLITPSHWGRRDTLRDGSIRVAWEASRAWTGGDMMISIWRAFSQATLFTG